LLLLYPSQKLEYTLFELIAEEKRMRQARDIDKDFESRNWLLLSRLARMGYNPKEAKSITRDIEAGKISFRDLIEKTQEK